MVRPVGAAPGRSASPCRRPHVRPATPPIADAAQVPNRKETRSDDAPQSRTLAKLVTAQLFSGAGIASGYAVGGLLAEQITGSTATAGFAQMSVILGGAGLVAYPLAALAAEPDGAGR